jgi:hypothetical protein
MAITFIADNEYAISNASSQVVSPPAGWQAGDLFVVAVGHGYYCDTATKAGPSWTMHKETGGTAQLTVFSRWAESADTTWTFGFVGAFSGALWIGCYRGVATLHMASSAMVSSTATDPMAWKVSGDGGTIIQVLSTYNTSTSCAHVTPGWGTHRATIDGTNGTRHIEMSVVEITAAGWYSSTEQWDTTNSSSYEPYVGGFWLDPAVPAGEQYSAMLDATGPASPRIGWMYKGRATAADDMTGAP